MIFHVLFSISSAVSCSLRRKQRAIPARVTLSRNIVAVSSNDQQSRRAHRHDAGDWKILVSIVPLDVKGYYIGLCTISPQPSAANS